MTYTIFFTCSLLPLLSSLFPVPYSLLPTPYSLLPVPCSLFPVPCSRLLQEVYYCKLSPSSSNC
ncbi:hypothetical protein [Moorena sp. SIO3I6]|uniref:hypothetical protein n=1 Tax=Moorena sp. SIO3I6 TaxID=2607831 RepID=UPI0013F79192|nr:hypothetical protein [Moorena sp. SIO3I6]NEP26004.1 hypothetical protein [Moorena sp. SIO3I6]